MMSCINDVVNEIQSTINSVNFNKIYKYFPMQKIAIYNDGFLYVGDKAIKFQNNIRESIKDCSEYVVINYESLEQDTILNVGKFIRKMIINNFYKHHDKRIPNDLIALRYPHIFLNYDYMSYEKQLILKALSAKDNYLKLNHFRMFLNVRDLRRQMIGNEFSMLEYNLETIEGLAQYISYKVIESLDKAKGKEFYKKIVNKFSVVNREYFDFHNANYNIGYLMSIVMVDLGIDISELLETDNTLYQFATSKIKFIREPISYRSDKALIENIRKYEEDVSEKFTLFFENNPERVYGSFQIFAYDPTRIFVDKDNLYHESFVVLKNLLNNELIKLDGPVITKVLENSIDIVTSYHYLSKKKKKSKK